MAINYPRMKATSDRLIKQNGMACILFRGGGVENVGGIEVEVPEEQLSIIGIIVQYKPHEIDGTLIEAGDIQIIATAGTEIRIGDRIEVDGRRYRVIQPNPVKPAAVLLLYKPQLRA